MQCELCSLEEIRDCDFSVVLSHYRGGWLFSRHRERSTWETQGGHIEPGETWEECARRELYEESGAVAASLTPLCGYWADRSGRRRYGVFFLAEVDHLDELPPSEIAEVKWFEGLPENLSYPEITPKLFAYALSAQGAAKGNGLRQAGT